MKDSDIHIAIVERAQEPVDQPAIDLLRCHLVGQSLHHFPAVLRVRAREFKRDGLATIRFEKGLPQLGWPLDALRLAFHF